MTRKEKRSKRDGSGAAAKIPTTMELAHVEPKTENQSDVFEDWADDFHLFIHGLAGTGKTFISLYLALRAVMKASVYQKIVIVRSAVPTRDQGFLPGSMAEKNEAYEAPYIGVCTELFGRGDAYQLLKQKGVIEFITTSYIRGTTLSDCIVIADEVQNYSFHELDSVITRVGENTRLIFTGDVTQSDFVRDAEKSGIAHFMKIIETIEDFSFIEFGVKDILRSGLVRDYIIAKDAIGTP